MSTQERAGRTTQVEYVEESRYIFNGALLLLKPEGVTMVSTDGHRLAYAEHTKAQDIKGARVLVSKKALVELSSLLNSSSVEQIPVCAG
jgi:DNA polymerase III subunit beta